MNVPAHRIRIGVQIRTQALVVLGASQRHWTTERRIAVARRCSGGGAVLDGPWLLKAAVLLPSSHPVAGSGPAAAASWFGALHCAWLAEHGVAGAHLYQGKTQAHWACFLGRAPGEVLVGTRKIVGIAQVWRRHAILLVAGTLLTAAPWPLLCAELGKGDDDARALATTTVSAGEASGSARIDGSLWADSLRARMALALHEPGGPLRPRIEEVASA